MAEVSKDGALWLGLNGLVWCARDVCAGIEGRILKQNSMSVHLTSQNGHQIAVKIEPSHVELDQNLVEFEPFYVKLDLRKVKLEPFLVKFELRKVNAEPFLVNAEPRKVELDQFLVTAGRCEARSARLRGGRS